MLWSPQADDRLKGLTPRRGYPNSYPLSASQRCQAVPWRYHEGEPSKGGPRGVAIRILDGRRRACPHRSRKPAPVTVCGFESHRLRSRPPVIDLGAFFVLAGGVSLPGCTHPMSADPYQWYCQLEPAPSDTDERHWYYRGASVVEEMMTYDDLSLMRRLQAGDEQAMPAPQGRSGDGGRSGQMRGRGP